jgi:large subunit ribosomal protein L15
MTSLNKLKDVSRERKPRKRVGRGIGSGIGKTCGRGEKGAKARSGYKSRLGYEGGQFRTYMKLPIRGFSNKRFENSIEAINLDQIEAMYEAGEVINVQTLAEKGLIVNKATRVKILGNGELAKKVKIEAYAFSSSAVAKLQNANVSFEIV